jgi:hypothetical protein
VSISQPDTCNALVTNGSAVGKASHSREVKTREIEGVTPKARKPPTSAPTSAAPSSYGERKKERCVAMRELAEASQKGVTRKGGRW